MNSCLCESSKGRLGKVIKRGSFKVTKRSLKVKGTRQKKSLENFLPWGAGGGHFPHFQMFFWGGTPREKKNLKNSPHFLPKGGGVRPSVENSTLFFVFVFEGFPKGYKKVLKVLARAYTETNCLLSTKTTTTIYRVSQKKV